MLTGLRRTAASDALCQTRQRELPSPTPDHRDEDMPSAAQAQAMPVSGIGRSTAAAVPRSDVFAEKSVLAVTLQAPFGELDRHRKAAAEAPHFTPKYFEGRMACKGADLPVRVRVRGNTTATTGTFPKLKIKARKQAARGTAFERNREIKVLSYEADGVRSQSYEPFLYDLANAVMPHALRSRRTNITYRDTGAAPCFPTRTAQAAFNEHPEDFAARLGFEEVESVRDALGTLDHRSAIRMILFNALIDNNDYGVEAGHNTVAVSNGERMYVTPHDFDSCAFAYPPPGPDDPPFSRFLALGDQLEALGISADEVRAELPAFVETLEATVPTLLSAPHHVGQLPEGFAPWMDSLVDTLSADVETALQEWASMRGIERDLSPDSPAADIAAFATACMHRAAKFAPADTLAAVRDIDPAAIDNIRKFLTEPGALLLIRHGEQQTPKGPPDETPRDKKIRQMQADNNFADRTSPVSCIEAAGFGAVLRVLGRGSNQPHLMTSMNRRASDVAQRTAQICGMPLQYEPELNCFNYCDKPDLEALTEAGTVAWEEARIDAVSQRGPGTYKAICDGVQGLEASNAKTGFTTYAFTHSQQLSALGAKGRLGTFGIRGRNPKGQTLDLPQGVFRARST